VLFLKKKSETTDDIIQKDVTSGAVTPSRIDLLNLNRSDTANEFNIVGSTNDIDEKVQNEKSGTDQTSNETNGMHENKEPIVDSTPTISTGCGVGDEYKQTEATIEDPGSGDNSTLQGTNDTKNKVQNAVTTTGPASNETEGAQNTRVVAEVRTKDTIPEEISAIGSIEDAKGADHHHEGTTVHSTYNVDDSAYQHTLTDTTSLKLSLVTSTSSIRESKHEETSADITSHKTNATDTTDNIVEQKNGEHVVDPTTTT